MPQNFGKWEWNGGGEEEGGGEGSAFRCPPDALADHNSSSQSGQVLP